ncbi:MAG: D-glycerate dehydrogenase [Ignavibacteriales bacterium CG_4_9_14_3_um_filter_34_10]|nr:MAG: D-glycerate dehydrogenase [Ignavibacteriales bacterium CG_4_9_14_3_um_filter_34_10]
MKVIITDKIPIVAEQLIKRAGFGVKVIKRDKNFSKNVLIKNIKDADAVISLLSDKIDKEVIDNMRRCKIIANYAVGFNNIDLAYAKSKGIIVTNTPDVLTDATADLAMTLILSCARRFHEAEKLVREKKFKGWAPELLLGYDLKCKTLGIIGAGRIGQATALRALGFGLKILYYNRTRKTEFENQTKAKKVSMNLLLKKSDFISIHLPLTNETKLLINRNNMKYLKPNAIVINTARGEIIDEEYLIQLLKSRKIFAAGFDVYENEPKLNPKLLKLENAILLPHIGSATVETRNAMAELAAKNVINVLNHKKALTQIN